MAELLLGPILRHVEHDEATIWLETDEACEVRILDYVASTFQVEGHHYALVGITGLEAGASYEYTVELDGERVWPDHHSDLPPSVLRTLSADRGEVRLAFGSCRVSRPHQPPHVLTGREHPDGHGIDALRALALRLASSSSASWPHCLLMLGDQIYADELSPSMLELTRDRREPDGVPTDELADFDEYALAYREAWSEPVIRWLLANVPVAMIFDDHEIEAQWKTSQAWVEEMRAKPWYERHVVAGLMAYWVYQHLGNLSLAELAENDIFRRLHGEDDAGELLREQMANADRQPGHSRWSFSRDLGRARLVAIDTRAGRELEPGRRRIIDDGEWEWVTERATGDFEHLLLASSVPFVLPPALHYAETWVEAIADGAWGTQAARAAEWVRRKGVMDQWASFRHSFDRLGALLEEIAGGERGSPPTTVVMLSGDVHHCYLAEIDFQNEAKPESAVWQCVSSAYRKELEPREKRVMRIANSRSLEIAARTIARLTGTAETRLRWRLLDRPGYENQLGTLSLAQGSARIRVETPDGSDWRHPVLRPVFEHELVIGGET